MMLHCRSACARCTAAGDCFAFVTVKSSGHDDLFVPFAVFLVPSLGFSAASIGLKFWLMKRRAVRRAAKLQALRLPAGQLRRIDFQLLCDRFVLHRRQQRHEELKSANDAARYQAYTYIALALTEVHYACLLPWLTALVPSCCLCRLLQDMPFCVLNTILLERAVRTRNDPTLLPSQRLCSAEYDSNSFLMLLLVLLTSVGMLVYKAMHLLPLPRVWAEHKRLAAEAAEFEECSAAIDRRMRALASEDSGPSASAPLYGTPADLEQQRIANSEPMGDAEVATGRGAPADRIAESCAHALVVDPEPEVARRGREIVGQYGPHARGTAHPSRTHPLAGMHRHASRTHNERRMRMLAATQVDLRFGSTRTATMRLPYRDCLMRGR